MIFTSDNGGHMPVTNRDILRGYKGTLDEGGVRVPWIVRWPGRVEPGVEHSPVHHVDLLPTLLALAGAEPRGDAALDGIDLTGLFADRIAPAPRPLFWHFPCYLQGKSDRFEHFRTTPGGVLRAGRWKLVEFLPSGLRDVATTRALRPRDPIRWSARTSPRTTLNGPPPCTPTSSAGERRSTRRCPRSLSPPSSPPWRAPGTAPEQEPPGRPEGPAPYTETWYPSSLTGYCGPPGPPMVPDQGSGWASLGAMSAWLTRPAQW